MNGSADLTANLPVWLREQLSACPLAGGGVHFWLFRTARHLLPHFDEQTTYNLLWDGAKNSGRPLSVLRREIPSQIKNALPCRWQPRNPETFKPVGTPAQASSLAHFDSRPAWPEPDETKIRLLATGDVTLRDLIERSPVKFNTEGSHAEEIIDVLFPGDPLLCVGKSARLFATRRRSVWRGHFHRLPLMVPSPMLEVIGRTTTGHLSQHTKEQTGRRIYLVVEFDFSEFARDRMTLSRWAPLVREWHSQGKNVADVCAGLHLHLAERMPLVCVTHSGGKSLHGWFLARGKGHRELHSFMAYAVSLGADPATWNRSQFVRIPDGQRENGQRQTCLYFNPHPNG